MTPKPHGPVAGARGVLSLPDDEAVDRWGTVPPEERLRWLAEANEFLWRAQPPEVRRLWHELRRAEW
ncbi:MAG: hypothetical protein SCH98_10890 [Deferrisomatales bacterium]|nr:hypothetical protein [Deferrisomatales bacterium]